ncbi:GNAT family N-acetyltransferase [Arenibacter sp. GZD96]|uniref:GNAT family N-acetyltransferase n=1 Tax=Aurantibrevibacter litoralis TaxID=3106030 RepID=UPI002AFED984|nr:GNAT family N-acetyltransferase [Arenibacter sp. GZD-96]MEA1787389.1 GNAT family N-acetyltransferase [Arenibacter sp. GZD-96]
MKFVQKEEMELFSKIFEENLVPQIYSGISYANEFVDNPLFPAHIVDEHGIYSLRLVPGYFTLALNDKFRAKKITQFNWSYTIILDSVLHVDAYVKSRFGPKATNIRKSVNRLETCFDIKYTMYCGEIEPETYLALMDSMKDMLERRFLQREENHKELIRWSHLCETTHSRILEKKASLFVIYNKDAPVVISLNHHFDKILFGAISAYDIDYAKFGMGHILIYKQLEWCLVNGFKIFEMGVGGMDYKRRWSNAVAHFEHHIVYPCDSAFLKCYAYLEFLKIRVKEYLKSKNVNTHYSKFKSLVLGPKKGQNRCDPPKITYHVEPLSKMPLMTDAHKVNLYVQPFAFLRKPVYDFLFTHAEHVNDVEVFELVKDSVYLIKGKSTSQKIHLGKQP